MFNVAANDKRLIEKDILSFFWRDSMPLPVLGCVRLIPFEPGTHIQRVLAFRHSFQYMPEIYKRKRGAELS